MEVKIDSFLLFCNFKLLFGRGSIFFFYLFRVLRFRFELLFSFCSWDGKVVTLRFLYFDLMFFLESTVKLKFFGLREVFLFL